MVDIVSLNNYFKKLQKVVNYECVLNLGKYRLVQKRRIDDIICCIYAMLPDSYKTMLKTKMDLRKYSSVLSYSMLSKILAKRFFLDKNLCIIDITKFNKLIPAITRTIEEDIHNIDASFEN